MNSEKQADDMYITRYSTKLYSIGQWKRICWLLNMLQYFAFSRSVY